jgi:ABC-type Fe3+/spermidine/putrescine transport system ATPase subunit
VFVTHDQEEALTMSDRSRGDEQRAGRAGGAPREVYEEPETVFVADFLGVSNLLAAEAIGATARRAPSASGERGFHGRQGEPSAAARSRR